MKVGSNVSGGMMHPHLHQPAPGGSYFQSGYHMALFPGVCVSKCMLV